jgi:WD40 repeat protein
VVLQDGHGPSGALLGGGSRRSRDVAVSSSGSKGLVSALPGAVTCVSFASGASDAFVTGGEDGTVRLWSAADYSVAGAAKERDAGAPLCCAQSLDLLAVGREDGTVRGYSGETMEHLFTVPRAHQSDKGGTTAVNVAGNERFLLSGGGEGSVRVWELRSREMICDLRGHAGRITDAAVFRDDVHAVTVSRDRTMVCWDLRKERRVSSYKQRLGAISAVALSHDQSVVLTGGQAKAITLWDLREAQPVQSIKDAHGGAEVTCIACLSQQDAIVSAGADGSVRVWDVRTGKRLSQGQGHTARVHGLAVAADGRQVVSVGGDGCVLVWNVFAEAAAAADASASASSGGAS